MVAVAPSARVTVPVNADRIRATTIPFAAAIARQGDSEVEFVAAGVPDLRTQSLIELRLRDCCVSALAAGAPAASWSILDAGLEAVSAYATWSGTGLLCVSTGRHQRGLGPAGWTLLRQSGVPLLVWGRRTEPNRQRYRRLVVGVDGTRPCASLVAAAGNLASRLGLELLITQVIPPLTVPPVTAPSSMVHGDVHETAFLHRIVETTGCPGSSYDMLHATGVAQGLLRFVGHDPSTILVVGGPSGREHRLLRPQGHVAREILRRSVGPVMLVPEAASATT
jgi:nucleotide-binding universal stress UspA family protein